MRARTTATVATLALAACSIPAKHFDQGSIDAPADNADAPPGAPDARPDANPAFSCSGQPLPTKAAASISFSGTISDPLGGSFANASVSIELTGYDPLQVLADASGAFGPVSQSTGGVPLTGYTMVMQSGYVTTFVYPPVPFVADASVPVLMLTASQVAQLAGDTDDDFNTGKAQLLVHVADCLGNAVSGATVSTNPAGTVRYIAGLLPSASATMTDSNGDAIIYNVTAGSVEIDATAGGLAFRSHLIQAGAGELTETGIQP